MVAAYCNDREGHAAYISNVSVLNEWTCNGIAGTLLRQCIAHIAALGLRQIKLEVSSDSKAAISLYEKQGFTVSSIKEPMIAMRLTL